MTSSYQVNPDPFNLAKNNYQRTEPDFVESTNEAIDDYTEQLQRRYDDFINWNNQWIQTTQSQYESLYQLTKTGKQVFEGVKDYQDYLNDNSVMLEAMSQGSEALPELIPEEDQDIRDNIAISAIENQEIAKVANKEGLTATAISISNNDLLQTIADANLTGQAVQDNLKVFWPIMAAGLQIDVSAFDPENPYQTYESATDPIIKDYIAQKVLGTYLYIHRDEIEQFPFQQSQIIINATNFYNELKTAGNIELATEQADLISARQEEAVVNGLNTHSNPVEVIVSTIETIKGDGTWAEAREPVGLWLERIAETNAVDQSKLYNILYEQEFKAHDGHVTTIAKLWPQLAARVLNAGAEAWALKTQELETGATQEVKAIITGILQNHEEGTVLEKNRLYEIEEEAIEAAQGHLTLPEIRQLPEYASLFALTGEAIPEAEAIQQLDNWPIDGAYPYEHLFNSIRDPALREQYRKKFALTETQQRDINARHKAFATSVDPSIKWQEGPNLKQNNLLNNIRRIWNEAFKLARSESGGSMDYFDAFQFADQETQKFIDLHKSGGINLTDAYDPQGTGRANFDDIAEAGRQLKENTSLIRSTDPWFGETAAVLNDALDYIKTGNMNSDGYKYYNTLALKDITITGADGINSVLNTRQLIQARLKSLNLLDEKYQPTPEELLSETARDLLTIKCTPGRTFRACTVPEEVEVNGEAINTGNDEVDAAATTLHTTSMVQGIDAHGGHDAVLVGSNYINVENNNVLEKPLTQYSIAEIIQLLAGNENIKQLGIYGLTRADFYTIFDTMDLHWNDVFDKETQFEFLQEKLRLNANKGSELSTLTNNSRRLVTIPRELHQQYIAQVGKQGMNDLKFLTPAAARYMIENPASTLIT
tara:strand:- start:46 stop:2691 length:2646 start_codon:yes stop_codon:yes gene_type:complete